MSLRQLDDLEQTVYVQVLIEIYLAQISLAVMKNNTASLSCLHVHHD